jgi:hypothetical protein
MSNIFGDLLNIGTFGMYDAVKKALKPPPLPDPIKPPSQITEQDPVVLRAAEDERRRQKNVQGRQSTITAPLVSSNTQNFKTILGG